MSTFGTQTVDYAETRADGGYEWDVRYDLSFHSAFVVDLRVKLVGDDGSAVQATWLEANDIWNRKAFFSDGTQLYEVKVDFRFVQNNEHQTVTVIDAFGRTDMTNWYLQSNWALDFQDQVVAHEVGHMLGNFDEYADGATFNNYTTSGTIMSDLSIGGFANYFFAIEAQAEFFGDISLRTVLAEIGNDFANLITGSGRANGVYGLGGADTIEGMGGGDYLDGGFGHDDLVGGRGSDKLFGVGGLDELKGGGGDDTINGGEGSDTITGGAGNDVMNGGRGPDTFVYTAVDQLGLTLATADFFKGFTPGSDTVDLSAIDAIAGGADDAFTLVDGAFTGRGEIRITTNEIDTVVQFNTTGNRSVDFQIFFEGGVALSATDFIL